MRLQPLSINFLRLKIAGRRIRVQSRPEAPPGHAMEVTATNGVKVYNVSAGKAVPQWLQDRKKKDKAYIKGLGA